MTTLNRSNIARRACASLTLTTLALAASTTAAHADPVTVPNPAPAAPKEVTTALDRLIGLLKYGGIAAVVSGFVMVGIAMALSRNGGHGGRESIDRLWYVAGGAIVIGTSSALAGFLLF